MHRKINIEKLHRKYTIETLRKIMNSLEYEQAFDYVPLTGEKDIFEYIKDEDKLILIINKKGESEQVLDVEGPDLDVKRLLFMFLRASTYEICRDILEEIVSKPDLDRLLADIDKEISELEGIK